MSKNKNQTNPNQSRLRTPEVTSTSDPHVADFGDAKIEAADSWRPYDKTQVERDPNFRYRHVHENNVRAKQNEGFQVDTSQQSNLGNEYVVMRIPVHMAKQRDAFFAQQHRQAAEAVKPENVVREHLSETGFVVSK